nr:YdaS family helix-turn-helix protein [uncultured Rhodoferax sp.]
MNKFSPSVRLAYATKCGVAEQYLYQVLTGRKVASPELCVSIERATSGQVTRQELRPDDWQAIWPELAKRRKPAPATVGA